MPEATEQLDEGPWMCENGPYHGREILFVEPDATEITLPVRPGIDPTIRPVTEVTYVVDRVAYVLRWKP